MRYNFRRDTDYSNLPTEWIALDTETGGLDATKHALLSVAVWSPDYHDTWLTKPFGVVEPEALKINGLSTSKCSAEGINAGECGERLLKAIAHKAIVGQNIGFDLGFIAHRVFGFAPDDAGMHLFRGWRLIDTCDMFKRIHPDQPRHLHEIAEFYGIEAPGEYHNALYDAEVTGRVFMAMASEMNKTC